MRSCPISSVLVYSSSDQAAVQDSLRAALPEHEVLTREELADPASVTIAVAWQPPDDFFDGLVNLRQVHALSAGVDRLLTHPGLPTSVPIFRLVDAGMGVQMAEYVLYGVLHAHRGWPALSRSRREGVWHRTLSCPPASEFTVGVLGLGALGCEVAQRCRVNGYRVKGWSRNPRTLPGVQCSAGRDNLAAFAEDLDVLACLLPLTPDTTRILDAELFEAMPRGSFVINLARGEHLHETDLIRALDSGQLSGALLDVFTSEPLPAEHPFWKDDRILISPHVAAPSPVDTSVAQIAANIRRDERGEPLTGEIDRQRGY